MSSTCYSCRILMKLEFWRQILEKCSNIKCHENLSSGSQVVPCRQTDVMKVIVTFRNFANVPKNQLLHGVHCQKSQETHKPLCGNIYRVPLCYRRQCIFTIGLQRVNSEYLHHLRPLCMHHDKDLTLWRIKLNSIII